MNLRRILSAAAIAAIATGTLSACSPQYPMAARIVDGAVTVALCQQLNIEQITFAATDDTSELKTVWDIEGAAAVRAGYTIGYATLPSKWQSITPPHALDPVSDRIVVTIAGGGIGSESGRVQSGDFAAASITEGDWVTPAGVRRSSPCG